MARKKKTDEVSDEEIFLMTEGLTPELIKVRNEQLRDEFLQLKEDMGLEEDDDDTMLYRSFVGTKLAVLLNVVEHLLRANKETNRMFADAMEEIGDALDDKAHS